MSALTLEDVHFHWPGGPPILSGVGLGVAPGEVVALLGRNGAGKSTLLGVASGWLTPSRGRVRVEGRDVAALDRRTAARLLASLAADEEPHLPFTVAETVALGRHPWRGAFGPPRAEDIQAVEAAIERLSLGSFRDRPVGALSSGERRRVGLARVLAQGAPVMLLDEPTVHLDVGVRLEVLSALRAEAHERRRALVLVMHDLAALSQVADRVIVLADGRIALDGPPQEVLLDERLGPALGVRFASVPHPRDGSPLPIALEAERAPE